MLHPFFYFTLQKFILFYFEKIEKIKKIGIFIRIFFFQNLMQKYLKKKNDEPNLLK